MSFIPNLDHGYRLHPTEIYFYFIDTYEYAWCYSIRGKMKLPLDEVYKLGITKYERTGEKSWLVYKTPSCAIDAASLEKLCVLLPSKLFTYVDSGVA